MGIKKIAILLDGPLKCKDDDPDDCFCEQEFQQGETIKGVLYLKVGGKSAHKLHHLDLVAYGKAKTSWPEGESDTASDTQDLFFVGIPLTRQPIKALPPGEHHFEFLFKVPENIPPTMTLGAGKVQYKFSASAISSGMFSSNASTKLKFTVLPFLDLRRQTALEKPLVVSAEADEPLFGEPLGECDLYLERRGFVPGETIRIQARGGERLLEKLVSSKAVLRLKYDCECRAQKKTRTDKGTVCEVRPTNWTNVQLRIPRDVYISMDDKLCKIINISWYLKLKSSRLNVHVPITIGTETLRDTKYAGR